MLRVHIFIRKDLNMSKGKICSQTAHAVLGLYKDLLATDELLFAQWSSTGFPQVTYEATSYQDLVDAVEWARGAPTKIITNICHDAGRTQVNPMTGTVAAIGPCSAEEILPFI